MRVGVKPFSIAMCSCHFYGFLIESTLIPLQKLCSSTHHWLAILDCSTLKTRNIKHSFMWVAQDESYPVDEIKCSVQDFQKFFHQYSYPQKTGGYIVWMISDWFIFEGIHNKLLIVASWKHYSQL